MAIHHIPHTRKWNHKHIILVTLTGTLMVITVVVIISIVLSPAHISFTLENPTSGKADEEDTRLYSFTLVAHNESPRMMALYGAPRAEIWYSQQTASVPAVVVDWSSLHRTTRQGPTYINMSAEFLQLQFDEKSTAASSGESAPGTDESDWSNCTVLVTATVWFKYGWITTRSYNVLAYCSPVNFYGTGGDGNVACE